jgi:hypothetical protein
MPSPMKALAALALVALTLGLAACGSDAPGTGGGTNGDVVGTPQGDGMSVQEAAVVELFGPVLVNGILVETGGELRLCDTVMESEPPQCSEPFLTVVGSDLPDLPRGEPISVRGTVESGEITPTEE